MLAGSTQLAWRDHGRDAQPDYDRVFAQDVVKRLDIRIAPAEWARLIADMTDMAGAFGGDRSGFGAAPDPAPCGRVRGAGRREHVQLRHAIADGALHVAFDGRGPVV